MADSDATSAPAQEPIMLPQVSMSSVDVGPTVERNRAQGPPAGIPSLATLMQQMQQLEAFRGLYSKMMAQAQEAEKPPTLYTAADVPIFVDYLSSNEPETFNKVRILARLPKFWHSF